MRGWGGGKRRTRNLTARPEHNGTKHGWVGLHVGLRRVFTKLLDSTSLEDVAPVLQEDKPGVAAPVVTLQELKVAELV